MAGFCASPILPKYSKWMYKIVMYSTCLISEHTGLWGGAVRALCKCSWQSVQGLLIRPWWCVVQYVLASTMNDILSFTESNSSEPCTSYFLILSAMNFWNGEQKWNTPGYMKCPQFNIVHKMHLLEHNMVTQWYCRIKCDSYTGRILC